MLERIRELAEKQVNGIIDRVGRDEILNGSNPLDWISQDEIAEYVELAREAWDDGVALASDYLAINHYTFDQLYGGNREAAIKESAGIYYETVGTLVQRTAGATGKDPIIGEFSPGQNVQGADVRPILTALGGGSSDPNFTSGTGITLGLIFVAWLNSQGVFFDRKVWIYGPAIRRTFQGHKQLNNLVFRSWNDERLTVRPEDAWIKRQYYSPSDHFGCRCVVAPYITPV